MNDKKPENPRAFARPAFYHDIAGDENEAQSGMTLRDYFAAAALQGFIARHSGLPTSLPMEFEASERAYKFADAMLKAREL